MRSILKLTVPFLMASLTIVLSSWGFFAHKCINRHAIFSLPPSMLTFYKASSLVITEHAVDPDKRRYAVPDEACRHYIDLDHYPEILISTRGFSYSQAVAQYTEDTLKKHGTLPWTILLTMNKLTKAFEEQNYDRILKYSADLGHYIGDAHVPLHTTSNYNGQKTNQHGIHGLWESRLPELYFKNYDLWVGKAEYLQSPADSVWKCIFQSHVMVGKVLEEERNVSEFLKEHKKYTVEHRNGIPVKTYSSLFCQKYNERLEGMVELRFRKAIKMTADCWFTCWVNAGQPKLPLAHKKERTKIKEKQTMQTDENCMH
jgi:hypothetical protein